MKALWTLNPYFWKYKWLLFSGIFFVILSAGFAVYPAIYVREAFDKVAISISESANTEIANKALRDSLILYSLLILGMSVLKGLFTFLMRQTLIVMSRHIEYDLKNDIYDQYQRLDNAFYRKNSTGDLMNRISEDVSKVRMYLGPSLMYTINTAFATILTLVFMFSVDFKLSLLTLAPMPVLVWCIYKVSGLINLRSHAVQRQQSAISTLAQETFSGLRVLKAFGLEKEQTKRYASSALTSFEKNEKLYRVNALFMPLLLLLVGTSTLIAVWIGGEGVIAGRLSPGVIAEFIYYVNLLTWPIASIGWIMSMVQRAEASMERVNDFLKIDPEIINAKNTLVPNEIKGLIEFKCVSFTYPQSGKKAIIDLSIKIKAGETVVIVGKTGSGKSTLVSLINRLMDPQNGSISIDGIDVKSWPLERLRLAIGTVPQDPFLFSDSISDNISFGASGSSFKDVKFFAEIANLTGDIESFSDGFNTIVGERGITLSGGQKQRLSIARALLKRPQLVIFDDALSSVDTDTEVKILSALKSQLNTVTTLIVTQRLSAVHLADRILVFDNGHLVQQGSHIELMDKIGIYKDLYRLQNPENWKQ
ncbi:MAG: putative multidrug resistance ABC transporter ATP-binding/permease protein YheI [Owenweeksia sp. TMED14]|nr:MAG: putative multidrug resistance ABC transporter ATP-binding/permease protein YheI [Owenweeksia sp. TMED14]